MYCYEKLHTYEAYYERVQTGPTLIGHVAVEEAGVRTIEGADAETVIGDNVMRVCISHQEGAVVMGPLVPSHCWVGRVGTGQGQGAINGKRLGGRGGRGDLGRCYMEGTKID